MIKHHPKLELLQNFVNGDLPASLSAGIAIHAQMCPVCQEKIDEITEQIAESYFEVSTADFSIDEFIDKLNLDDSYASNSMIDDITASDITTHNDTEKPITSFTQPSVNTINFKGKSYPLPNVLQRMNITKPANIGKLSRAKVQLNEGEIHTNILHIEPGGSVPEHTHKGFELTVLLAGSFSDNNGEYVAGDFIMLDSNHTHNPISENGCLCYTVANDALHFTQGINRLLNPIGSLIY